MKIWKNFLMVGCEDGFVYVFNKFQGQEEARIDTFSNGSSPLSIDFVENKVRDNQKIILLGKSTSYAHFALDCCEFLIP
jgi:hypothetical protein